MAAEKRDDFEIWFERLGGGSLIDFLRHDRFPAWVELVSRDSLNCELGGFAASLAGAADQARKDFQASQVAALARRLLLSRNAVLLDRAKMKIVCRPIHSCIKLPSREAIICCRLHRLLNRTPIKTKITG